MVATVSSRWAFPRIWLLLMLSYFGVKMAFNVGVMGYIDLRPAAFYELLLVPLGQAVFLWFVTRRQRPVTPAADPPR